MKLLIVAGGGGHFAPALAVIEALPKDVYVMVIGRKYAFEGDSAESLEYQTAKKLGIAFVPLTTGRLQRKLTKHSLLSLAKVPAGYLQALKVLQSYKPDVVLSFGGYVSVPVVFAAKTLGIRIVVHEQILGAGVANKIASKFADKVCVSWKESAKFFPKEKVILTGNPIRKVQKSSFTFQNEEKLPIIYVTGGSGGSHGINLLIEDCLEKFLGKYIVIHQTGDAKQFGDFDRLEKKRESLEIKLKNRYIVTKFVDPHEVFSIMDQADLVVSRSGMNTVTELLSLGKPCLLIPLLHGQHNEQQTNALFVHQAGIAEIAEQKGLQGEELYNRVVKMIENIEIYKEHGRSAKALVIPDATVSLINVVTHGNTEKKVTGS
jgi:UDP-N-acetylglucosamine--N-acetylmuramyl-(pentapeptide) pyrophosphoryl-undecaprenol N-acetylglucosamine transferase